jgi:DNA-binding CsgD family transcriptional regulator
MVVQKGCGQSQVRWQHGGFSLPQRWSEGQALQRTAESTANRIDDVDPRSVAEIGAHQRRAQGWFDQSLKAILDDLSDGVLIVNAAGHRIYSNPALDDLVGTDACFPYDTSDPPPYVPRDQRQKYLRMLEAMASLLSVEGSGTASTRFELVTRDRGRVRARMTISAFPSAGRGRFAVCLLTPEPPARAAEEALFSLEQQPPMDGDRSEGRGRLPEGTNHLEPLRWPDSLTRRERDVLALLLDGRRVASIARTLYLSEHTVRNHLKAIFRKLGAHSQAELLDRLRPIA